MGRKVLTAGKTKAGGDYQKGSGDMYSSGGGMDKGTGHPRKRILSGPKDRKGYQKGNRPLPASGADGHNPKLGGTHSVLEGVDSHGYQEGHFQVKGFSNDPSLIGSGTPAKNPHGFRHEGARIQGALRTSGHPGAHRIGAKK